MRLFERGGHRDLGTARVSHPRAAGQARADLPRADAGQAADVRAARRVGAARLLARARARGGARAAGVALRARVAGLSPTRTSRAGRASRSATRGRACATRPGSPCARSAASSTGSTPSGRTGPRRPPGARRTYLLAGFDEYFLGYKDRDAVIDPAHAGKVAPGANGIFRPLLVIGGQIAGTWERSLRRAGAHRSRCIRSRPPAESSSRPRSPRLRATAPSWASTPAADPVVLSGSPEA